MARLAIIIRLDAKSIQCLVVKCGIGMD
jgi:hypothetical protein